MTDGSGKRCPGCCADGVRLPRDAFARNRARPDGLQTHCRACRKPVDARRYQEHGPTQRRQILRARGRRVDVLRDRLWAHLEAHPCADCGVGDPVVLELHHEEAKAMDLNRLLAGGYSWPRMLEELAKGVILCANCHRRREARARGFWRERFRQARLEQSSAAH